MGVKIATHPPVEGKGVELYVAVLPKGKRKKPVACVLTAGAAAKGAVAVTVTGLVGAIQKGQYLLFTSTDGDEFICQVSVTSGIAATSLTVFALPEAIPAGATAQYPTYIWDRKGADLNRSYKFSGVTTFNTGGAQDGIVTGVEKTTSLPGLYYVKNAGLRTIKWCSENDREFWFVRTMPAPSDEYIAGDSVEGPAICTGIKEGAPDEGFVTADIEITFLGKCAELDPVPVTAV